MPRRIRMYLPEIPAHVVQRGNNSEICFFTDDDYKFYLECLKEGLARYHVQLHAYSLMPSCVHLLMSPDDEAGISRVMQHMGRFYVRYVNKTYKRTGALWEGRHKSSLIDADNYLLTCYRYIELAPVFAHMVEKIDEYKWSSYRNHAWGKYNSLITDHACYAKLGNSPQQRQLIYRESFKRYANVDDTYQIRECLDYNFPLGDERFIKRVECALGKSLGHMQRGRPLLEPGI